MRQPLLGFGSKAIHEELVSGKLTLVAVAANKYASPYIRERFGENSVGGKWLMAAELRIPLTLLGRGRERLGLKLFH